MENRGDRDEGISKARRQVEEAPGEVKGIKTVPEVGKKDSPGLGEVVLGKLEDFPEDFPLETF